MKGKNLMSNVIQIPEKTVKRKRRLNLAGIIVLFLLAAWGVVALVGGVISVLSVNVGDAELLSVDEIKYGHYYVDELVILDQYAATERYYGSSMTGDGLVSNRHLLAYYVDDDGKVCYVSLSVDRYNYKQDEISDLCDDFIEDDTKNAGDLKLSGCFIFQEISEGSTMDSYYSDFYDRYSELYPGEKTQWGLVYECATAEEYLAAKRTSAIPLLIVSAAFLLPSAIGLFFLIRKRKYLRTDLLLPSGEECVQKIIKADKKAKILLICGIGAFVLGFALAMLFSFMNRMELGGIGIMIVGCSILILAIFGAYYPVSSAKKLLEKEGISLEEAAVDIDNALFVAEKIRCGRKVLLMNNKVCIPLRGIAWIYLHEVRSAYGLVTTRSIVLRTFSGKKMEVTTGSDDLQTISALLNTCGEYFSPELILGFSREARKRYRELLRVSKNK